MQEHAGLGLWEIFFWLITGSGLLGLPPGERDPALVKSVPPQTFLYFEWASLGEGRTGASGVDGFVADSEKDTVGEAAEFEATDVCETNGVV